MGTYVWPDLQTDRERGIASSRLSLESQLKGDSAPDPPGNERAYKAACNCSKETPLVSGTIVLTHRSCRHIIPVKKQNT